MWKKGKDMGRKLNGEYLESSRVWENGVNKADFLLSIVTGKYTQALLCNRLDLHGDLRRTLLPSCGLPLQSSFNHMGRVKGLYLLSCHNPTLLV